ncbi:MAG: preprotein translocase subunit SecG [Lachnospiraceae bacterium]|nr:preprotein translocase subunit SecG [Lachnospiraceae bacterium]
MQVVSTILTILLAIVSIALIVLVMLQEGNERGLTGSIAGGMSETSFAVKNSGRTKEGQLKKYTRIALAVFMVIALAIGVLQKFIK